MEGNHLTHSPEQWDDKFAHRAKVMTASEIRELLKLLDDPQIISFAGGIPDGALFPQDVIKEAYNSILSDPDRAVASLQYSVSEGYLPLRQWLVSYMAARGVTCDPDNIVITNGSQQALDFLGRLFIDPGDQILVARPTYLGALQAFNSYEPSYGWVDDPAPDLSKPAKLAYVMPDFQNPTGQCMSLEQRQAMLDLAHRRDVPMIEDGAYEKLRYDNEDMPPLLALEQQRVGHIDNGLIMYCGTFSKTIVPALRLGWVVAPRNVTRKLVLIKQASDLHCSTLNQMVMYEVASRSMEANLHRIRDTYRTRRDAMLSALDRFMPKGVSWQRPGGGMFIWVTLPEGLDAAELLKRALKEVKVAFVPGAAFFSTEPQRNTLRLSFSCATPEMITEGISRLGQIIARG